MNVHTEVAETLAKLAAMAQERRPDDQVLREFIQRYYRELPDEDADDRRLDDAYAAAVTHLTLGRRRAHGDVLVRVLSPKAERDGWRTERSVLMFVTDDVPFLVDTVRMVLDRHGLGIHLLVHPTLCFVRDGNDEIVRFADPTVGDTRAGGGASDDASDAGVVEAWVLIELDRCPPDLEQRLEADVATAIDDVMRVVADFAPMRDRMCSLADGDRLLEWLGDQHFVLLGAASFDRLIGDDGTPTLRLQPGTELGEYRPEARLDASDPTTPSKPGDDRTVIARTEAVSTIHRAARMTCISIRPATDGGSVEHRFVGLLGSGAYRESVFAIPTIGDRAREILDLAGTSEVSHLGRSVKHVVETLPREVVFELDSHTLAELVIDIVGLQERRIVRVFEVAEPVGPWTTVFVYVPQARFESALPEQIRHLVEKHYASEARDLHTLVGASSLARITMTVRSSDRVDLERLAAAVDDVSTTWDERAETAICEVLGDIGGRSTFAAVRDAIPTDYRARVAPEASTSDLVNVARLLDTEPDSTESLSTSLGRAVDAPENQWRFRVFRRGVASTIAELVPLLDHLGLHAVDEHPYAFDFPDGAVHLYDIGVRLDAGSTFGTRRDDTQQSEVRAAFAGLMNATVEADGLNRLIIAANLDRRQVAVLRTYARYLHQAGFPFSRSYVEEAIVRHAGLASLLARLFDTRFDPTTDIDAVTRLLLADEIRSDALAALDEIPSLDDDRICRAILTLIDATSRTNAFRHRRNENDTVGDGFADEIAVKFKSRDIAFLPEPRPMFEIFVCSPMVEGVHLRGGRVARGGLRWSDRPEDFRTEVLGLVKAQMVKNAVIVPVGAKGGFVIKNSSAPPEDRDAVRAEGVDRYRRFIRSLLDVTDNLDGPNVVRPTESVIYDEDDPYLVVAADKGTATFSDIANELASEVGFWLGDAFASGGSVGYDHKAMGITARGAWESVRRHARVIGKDVDTDEMTVVGVGDMSGDVFGNGMLLSAHLKIVAAFDHRHVFLDPDPDPAASHEERARLFELPRSSWADYDSALISSGGGVHPRSAKSIEITDAVRDALGIDDGIVSLRPDELISAILRAPVDLLWNGGIGTYVKASTESHEAVGDRANDSLRVDATDLRCRIVGEGGNLGLTQLARVEYAMAGGYIYADAIDNSAGVDCSDHEVNIKIVLDQLVRDGDLTVKQRNDLLVEMTGEVAELVLDDNRAQTLALMIARGQALPMVNVHARYLDALENDGVLDRSLEFLPTDKQIAERQSAGSGLRAPEFAVMIAYTKNVDIDEILATDLPESPVLEADLLAYFPTALRERFPDALRRHRLRREIVTTGLVNNMVNLAGISFDHRMTEDSGASVPDVARAFLASRNIFHFGERWREIDELGTSISLDIQVDLLLEVRRICERGTAWLLRHMPPPLDIEEAIGSFSAGIALLSESLEDTMGGRVAEEIEGLRLRRIDEGVPATLAAQSARWPWMHTAFDMTRLARDEGCDVSRSAAVYGEVFEAFDIGWMWDGIGALPRSDRWQTQARSSMRDDLMNVIAELTRRVMRSESGTTEAWVDANQRAVARTVAMHQEIRRAESYDLTTLSVALRQLRNLTTSAVG
ncbi:MAG: NAD-glutamate dehydrogenase [Ilumatobacter sp.]|uniref:NAD-glutamate dehydrogenase n=1 Tax=Ilumatobacter sp. TaxID=1967498 RepID=UPI00329A2ACE